MAARRLMSKPAIILIHPQLGENIGMAARAMLNFGLTDLRLVKPRDGWPNPDAVPAAAGADSVLENAKLFATTEQAIADLEYVFAATARHRDLQKDVVDTRKAGKIIRGGGKAGIMFGPEASGLSNDDVVLADKILSVPVNPEFNSLNLAVAVGLIAYECFSGEGELRQKEPPATKKEMVSLFEHLEDELGKKGYFHPRVRRKPLVQTLRNLLQSASLNSQQVQTLRGVIKALAGQPKK